jgi:NTE family protein
MITPPDVLVLGGGGVLGEVWMMGVLAGVEDATGFDLRECEYFVGTSAGSIVCAQLTAGESPRRPSSVQTVDEVQEAGSEPVEGLASAARHAARRAGAWAVSTGATFAPVALGLAAPGGALVRAAMLQRVPRGGDDLSRLRARIERSGARFDGRLRVTAVDRRSGRRIVFGSPGAPDVTVAQAVTASCTVPWLFAPVAINGREYVDGGVWSPTNLDAAPAGRGTHVLCLNPTASLAGTQKALAAIRTVSRSAVSVEAMVLRRRGAAVTLVAPSAECAAAMGTNFMDPEPSDRVIAAAYRQGLRFAREPVSA